MKKTTQAEFTRKLLVEEYYQDLLNKALKGKVEGLKIQSPNVPGLYKLKCTKCGAKNSHWHMSLTEAFNELFIGTMYGLQCLECGNRLSYKADSTPQS